MNRRASRRLAAALVVSASTLGGWAAVAADEEPKSATVQPAAPVSGLRAIRDPETGRLGSNPTAEQRQVLALQARAAIQRSVLGLRPFALDGGGQGINLQGRFASALRVRVAEDGSLQTTCGHPEHAAGAHAAAHDDANTAPAAPAGQPSAGTSGRDGK